MELFGSWQGLARVVVVGTLAYLALLILLRISGRRTLSKMNSFDFVVTVALGSTLASTLLSKDTPLAQGVVALALLIALQYVITWLSVRSKKISYLVKAEPRLLAHRGAFLPGALREERFTHDEVLQAMRTHGIADLGDVEAIVLETDGSLTFLQEAGPLPDDATPQQPSDTALSNVTGF